MRVQRSADFVMISSDDRQEGLDCRIKVLAIFTQDHTAKGRVANAVEIPWQRAPGM